MQAFRHLTYLRLPSLWVLQFSRVLNFCFKNSLNIVNYATEINNVIIYNLNGQEVLNKKVNANQIKLNTSNIQKGLYIVNIKSKNASIKRKLVIE